MDAPWDLVVKVKYGNTLRRFAVNINGLYLDYDVNKLREKITSLFELDPNTNYTLTYTDEDGDFVTLVNDEELRDAVVGQRLNPLRINIQLASEPSNPPSKTSTGRSSPQLRNAVNEALKSVPDPLCDTISKMSLDFASKAAETAPALAELMEYFSKLGLARAGTSQANASSNSDQANDQVDLKHKMPSVSEISPPKESFETDWIASMAESTKMSGGPPVTVAASAPNLDQMVQDPPVTYPTLDDADLIKGEAKAAAPSLHPTYVPRTSLPVPPDPFLTSSPWHRAIGHHDNAFRMFHCGIRCDGCGMHPIMGPRFKSNVKEDYDLCSMCFTEIGNEAEYTRIERSPYRPPKFHRPRAHGCPSSRGPGLKLPKGKLDSRFIQDVTVMDGTPMAPSTCFTKIWRMCNNGSISWPAGTQLLWIGGDRFSDRTSALLEISGAGHPIGSELDVAVDFKAPSKPGRYISYWRMVSPYGQKFGQRVWVLIQVDDSRPTSASGVSLQELNLNLPPAAQELPSSSRAVDIIIEPVETPLPEPVELNKPSTEDLYVQTAPPPPWNYPVVPPEAASSAAAVPLGETSIENLHEQTLLKELEEMGFKQTEANREILRANDYDLEKSINELCGISEWDPMLEELQEMGFCDKKKNKELLIKNGGSIKRVVLDLIAGEKDE